MRIKNYIKNCLIAVDQLLNTFLGGNPDETISSRVYRASEKHKCAKVACKVIDAVFGVLGDENHCKTSYENECKCPVHDNK